MFEDQHVELLPERTVMTCCCSGGTGGNGGNGGNGGSLNLVAQVNVFGDNTASVGNGGNGGAGGSS